MLRPKTKAIAFTVSLGLVVASVADTLATPTSTPPKQTQNDAKPSQAQCLELFGKLLSGTPLSSEESERSLTLFKQCQSVFWNLPDPNAPLPTATECLNFYSLIFDAFRENHVDKLAEISAEQQRSLLRCREVIEARYIPAGSMSPTLQINDYLFIDKVAYRSQPPNRGDIVLFQPTDVLRQQNFKDAFVKRIVGLPGEKVEVNNGSVYINGKRLQENYLAGNPDYQYGPVFVAADQYFVLGDNRNNSYDSHYWGFVPRSLIIGKALSIYCPIERQQLLSNVDNLSGDKKAAMSKLFQSIGPICTNLAKNQSAANQRTSNPSASNYSEARQFVRAMNRAQQAFYLERNRFARNVAEMGISPPSGNYKYAIRTSSSLLFVQNLGLAIAPGLKSYVGFVTIGKAAHSSEPTTYTILCESNKATTAPPRNVAPKLSTIGEPSCPTGYSDVQKH